MNEKRINEDIKENISKILIKSNYKFTSQRKKIIDLFVNSNEHLRAEDVHEHIKKEDVSLPTVYRTLEILSELNIIKSINIDNIRYYELKIYSKKKLHIHFKCNECNQISEFKDHELISGLLNQREFIERKYCYAVDDISVVMKGICKECS